VDILVVMPARDESSKAFQIRRAVRPQFAWAVIVRTPERLEGRLRWGDWFLREIVSQGKTLYDKRDRRMGAKGRKGLEGGAWANEGKGPAA
jgi:hypothetical protein